MLVIFYGEDDQNRQYYGINMKKLFDEMVVEGSIDDVLDRISEPEFTGIPLDLSRNPLRNLKNNCIVLATLLAVAAVNDGLSKEESREIMERAVRNFAKLRTLEEGRAAVSDLTREYAARRDALRHFPSRDPLVIDTARYIRDHIYEALKTGEIADALYVSRSYLSQRFREETGLTLTAYIRRQKVAEAKRLILRTDMSLVRIAGQLAFSSQSYFTKVFREETGMTPKEFRESERAAH